MMAIDVAVGRQRAFASSLGDGMAVGAVGPRGVRRRGGLVLPAVIAIAIGAVVLPAVVDRGVPAASATVGSYATEVAADAPIHWWRLGDTSAPATDSAGSTSCSSGGSPAFGSTGLLINDADDAVSFGGSDHLECGGWMSLIGEPEATLEAWVTVDSLPSSWPYLSAVAGWEGFQLRVDGSGYVEFVLADGCCTRSARSSSPISVGESHHLVGVFDNGNVDLFVDGVLSGNASGWSTSGSHGYFWIGDALYSGRSLVGTVDEVAMYDKALAGGRVVTHFEAGRDGFTAPVADTYSSAVLGDSPSRYWRFGDASGSPVVATEGLPCRSVDDPVQDVSGLLDASVDSAVSFDGTSHLDCGLAGYGSQSAASIEAWVQLDSLPTASPYLATIAGWDGFQLQVDGDGYAEFVVNDGCCTRVARSLSPIEVGEVHHLVGVFDSGNSSLFVDGVHSGGASGWSTLATWGAFWIGQSSAYSGRGLDGTVDEVATYDSALSIGAVQAHFEAGAGALSVPVSDGYSTEVAADSPSRYWRLGDADSVRPVDGDGGWCRQIGDVELEAPSVLAASVDSSAAFDPVGGYLWCGPTWMHYQPSVTVEAWVTIDSANPTSPYISHIAGTSEISLTLQGTVPSFEVGTVWGTSTLTGEAPLTTGVAHHLVGTFEAGVGVAFYVDGIRMGSDFRNQPTWDGGAFTIGASPAGNQRFDGRIDEVATYPTALTHERVLDHYEVGVGGFASPAADGYSAAVAADAPVQYWRLGDADAVQPLVGVDTSCEATGSTGTGAGGLVNVGTDNAVSFGSGQSYLDCGLDPNTGNDITIEAWVDLRAAPSSPSSIILAGSPGTALRLIDGGAAFQVSTVTGGTAAVSSSPLPLGVHHVVGVRLGIEVFVYLDGIQAGYSLVGWPLAPAGHFWIGGSPSDTAKLSGVLDEVAVYDRALSLGEINDHRGVGGSILADGPLTLDESRGGGSCATCARSDQNVDPVSLPTGEYWRTFNDFAFPGRGVPLSLTHTYSSTAASTDGPLGFGWSMGFLTVGLDVDPISGLVTITQENGSKVTFDEDPGSPGDYVPTKARTVAELVSNGAGSWTYTESLTHRVFEFDSGGKLTTVSSEIGNTNAETTLAYSSGKLDTVTDAAGRELTFAWTGDRVTGITDNMMPSRSVTFSYDGNGDLVEWADVGGGSWAYTYDANHLLLTTRDPDQASALVPAVVTNVYDGSGRVTSQTDRIGAVTEFDYTAVAGAVVVTDGEGHVTLKRFADGLPVEVVAGYGTAQAASTLLRYDAEVAMVDTVRDPNGHWSKTTHDSAGNVIGTEDALGRTTSATYNARRQPLTTTDGEGVATTYSYDGAGNLTSVSTPLVGSSPALSRTVTYTYGDISHPGDVTAVTDARGKTTDVGYDADGNVDSVTDPLGNETATFHDDRALC